MADDPTALEKLIATETDPHFVAQDKNWLEQVRSEVAEVSRDGTEAVSAALDKARKELALYNDMGGLSYPAVGAMIETRIELLERAMPVPEWGGLPASGLKFGATDEKSPTDTGSDTGHYDDGHSFGWPSQGASDTGYYDFGWNKPAQGGDSAPTKDEPKVAVERDPGGGVHVGDEGAVLPFDPFQQKEPEQPPSDTPDDSVAASGRSQWLTPRKAAVGGGAVIAVIAAVVVAITSTGAGGGGHKAAPPPPAVASAPAFYAPTVLQLSPSLLSQLQGVAIPPESTTDPNAFGAQGALLTAYQDNGMLLHENAFVFHVGLDPAKEDSWPSGVSGSDNFGATFFQSHDGALAVEKASEASLLSKNFYQLARPDLQRQGIAAFEPSTPGSALLNQIWYVVEGNVFIAIADTGKLPAATLRPQEQALFNGVKGLLRPVSTSPSNPLNQAQAQQAYLSAVAPVNSAAVPFSAQAQRFNASTTNAQAKAAAQPLAMALDEAESQLATIAAGYGPVRADVYAAYAAAEVLKADLEDLSRLDKVGVSAWAKRYDADLTKLTAASNKVRSTLGLPATRS